MKIDKQIQIRLKSGQNYRVLYIKTYKCFRRRPKITIKALVTITCRATMQMNTRCFFCSGCVTITHNTLRQNIYYATTANTVLCEVHTEYMQCRFRQSLKCLFRISKNGYANAPVLRNTYIAYLAFNHCYSMTHIYTVREGPNDSKE